MAGASSCFLTLLPQGCARVSADLRVGDQLLLRFTFYTELPGNVVGGEMEMDWAVLPV